MLRALALRGSPNSPMLRWLALSLFFCVFHLQMAQIFTDKHKLASVKFRGAEGTSVVTINGKRKRTETDFLEPRKPQKDTEEKKRKSVPKALFICEICG